MSNAEKFKQMSRGLDLAQAIAEADRCLLCHDAPCSEACPADTKPAEFIRKLRFKNMTGAFRTIKENNILGGACGVLCPTSRLCEEKCSAMFKSQNRPEGADHPIQIGAIQRFLVEHFWDRDFKVFETPTRTQGKSGGGGIRSRRIELCRRIGQSGIPGDGPGGQTRTRRRAALWCCIKPI